MVHNEIFILKELELLRDIIVKQRNVTLRYVNQENASM